MPRNPKSGQPGTRAYKNFSEDSMNAAISAVKKKKMTLRQAAEHFKFPKSTLSYRINLNDIQPDVPIVGRPCIFMPDEEKVFAENLILVSSWGFPFSKMDLRYSVKASLDSCGRKESRFNNNLPGEDWVQSFLQRNAHMLSPRLCQNISAKRAKISSEEIQAFFENFKETSEGIPASHILNYDETNLSDDPGRHKLIFKRGVKYPERIMNTTKTATSIMFAGTASGNLLPPYVVYKAQNMWQPWTEGGPPGAAYNRSQSGWFDVVCFNDWFQSIVVPWAKRLEGKKIVIGDNLSSHFSKQVLASCSNLNISFVCLPANATHILQPLDVAFYGPLKRHWRDILLQWKKSAGRRLSCLPKDQFPQLLSQLMIKLHEDDQATKNLKSGFRTCGLHPFNVDTVLKKIPDARPTVNSSIVLNAVVDILKNLRSETTTRAPTVKRKKVSVPPGKSITSKDVETQSSTGSTSGSSTSQKRASDSNPGERKRPCTESIALPESIEVPTYEAGNWIIVQYETPKEKKSYAGQIIKKNDDGSYKVTFLRHIAENRFRWADPEDIDNIDINSVYCQLDAPLTHLKNGRIICIMFNGEQMKGLKMY